MTSPSLPPPKPSGRSNLALRIAAAAVLIPLTLAAARMGGLVWLGLVTLVAIGLYVEWLDLVGARTPLTLAAGLVALFVVALAFGVNRIGATWVLLALTLAVLALLLSPKRGWVLLGGFYALAALVSSVLVRGSSHEGFGAILFVLLLVWMTDTGGYVAGRSLGGPKLAPAISPNKTWAGAFGGLPVRCWSRRGSRWPGRDAFCRCWVSRPCSRSPRRRATCSNPPSSAGSGSRIPGT